MTALAPVPKVLRVILDWKVGADLNAITGHYFRYAGPPPSGAQCASIASYANEQATTYLKGLLHSTNSLQEVRVQDLNSSTGASGAHAGFGTGGLLTGLAPPANVAFVMKYGVAHRYRGGKPRNYFPFGSTGVIATPQTWEAAWVTSARTGCFNWLAAVAQHAEGETLLSEHVTVSYYYKGKWEPDPVTGRPRYIPNRHEPPIVYQVLSWTGRVAIGSQRRRLLN